VIASWSSAPEFPTDNKVLSCSNMIPTAAWRRTCAGPSSARADQLCPEPHLWRLGPGHHRRHRLGGDADGAGKRNLYRLRLAAVFRSLSPP